MKCQWCASENTKFSETKQSVHYGRYDCLDCARWVAWVKNPNSERTKNPLRKMKLDPKKVCEFHNFTEVFCFFCQRKKKQLGWDETITVDHIKELNKGGKDEIENQQILCTACHKLKNWARLYMNWHLNKGDQEDDTKKDREV